MTFLGTTPKLSERAWQGQVLQLARLFRWAFWHDNATNAPRRCPRCKEPIRIPRNTKGWPDLFLLRDDTLVIAELKAESGAPTHEQREWLERFRRVRRILVVVWKPRDLDAVQAALR